MALGQVNADQISFSSTLENFRFHFLRGKGHLSRYALNRLRWHVYPLLHRVTPYPEHVDMELAAICNMRCPMCYTVTPEFQSEVKRGLMEGRLWRKIVDECGQGKVFSLRLSLRGESTMHPEFVESVRYAKERGIREVSSLTNALSLTPERFERLVDAGMDWLTISADGIGETYNRIRKPAKFDEFLEKLRAFKEIKRRRRSAKPVIKVQTVWPAIKDDPEAYYRTFRPLVDQVSCNPLVDYLGKDQGKGVIEYKTDFDCHVLYQRLTIGSDGKVLFCLYDEYGHDTIGDMNSQSIHEIWHGSALTAAREAHRRHKGVEQYHACARCPLPRACEQVGAVRLDRRLIPMEILSGRVQEVGK